MNLPRTQSDDIANQVAEPEWAFPGQVQQRVLNSTPRDALAWLRIGLVLYPDAGYLHAHVGRILYGLGHWQEAEYRLRQALDAAPNESSLIFHLALIDARRGHLSLACKALEPLVTTAPNPDYTLVLIGWLMDRHSPERAREHAARGLVLWPDDPRFITAFARAGIAMHDYAHTLEVLSAHDDGRSAELAGYRRDLLSLQSNPAWREAGHEQKRRLIASHPDYTAQLRRVLDTLDDDSVRMRLALHWQNKLRTVIPPTIASSTQAVEHSLEHSFGPSSEHSFERSNVATPYGTPRVAMTILVRDEVDIIEQNIRYHYAQGIEHFVVTDNGSVDGTRECIVELQKTLSIELIDEPSHTIDQDLWVTRMAHRVAEHGKYDWVIHNDADEFWMPAHGSLPDSIQQALEAADQDGSDIGVLACKRRNLLTPNAPATHHYLDNQHVAVRATPLQAGEDAWNAEACNSVARPVMDKVLTRVSGLSEVGYGNHAAEHELATSPCNTIEIRHYPVRSREQFERKVVNYGQSLEKNTRFDPGASMHLRYWYRCWQEGHLDDIYHHVTFSPERLRDMQTSGDVEIVEPLVITN